MGRVVGNESFDKCTLLRRRVFLEMKQNLRGKGRTDEQKEGSPVFSLATFRQTPVE